eukprot:gene3759-18042_t
MIMKNVFYSMGNRIDDRYDLKGSAVGRFANRNENTKKDLDMNTHLWLGPMRKQIVADQIRRDTMFLEECSIMDYSLLVGVHNPSTVAGRRRTRSKQHADERCMEVDDGGMLAEGGGSEHAGQIYYLGIIDILQEY